jgi:hypothetical protein
MIFAYRVYFTAKPNNYYLVGASNVSEAIKRAKRSFRSFAFTSRAKCQPLTVLRIVRLCRGGKVIELKANPKL